MTCRAEPPLLNGMPLTSGEWWGSGWFVLRAAVPDLGDCPYKAREDGGLKTFIERCGGFPLGEKAELGPPRWTKGWCDRVLLAYPAYSVDAEFLIYAEAEVEPDEWRLCEPDSGFEFPVFLVGLRGSEPVAYIAPRKPTQ